jgi:6-pyruvoyltetrahydropterin/6-carboxytetrahydropterin synthase
MTIDKRFYFEAAHRLPRHKGQCRHLHGHSWELVVRLEGRVDPRTAFVADFADLKAVVSPLVAVLDHSYMNAYIGYPSSEVTAALLHGEAFGWSPLVGIYLSETRTSGVHLFSETAPEDRAALMKLAAPPSINRVEKFPFTPSYDGETFRQYVEALQYRWADALREARSRWEALAAQLQEAPK